MFWAQGKIWRVNVASREVRPIRFEAEMNHTVYEPLRFPQEVAPDTFDAKMIKQATTSPTGSSGAPTSDPRRRLDARC